MHHALRAIALASTMMLLTACSSFDSAPVPKLDANAHWAVLAFSNATETPMAGQRAEALALTLLSAEGISEVSAAPLERRDTMLGSGGDVRIYAEALDWARKQGVRYAVTGEVFEWRYKVGVDGEPAVGLSLRLIDVPSGRTLWAGAASKSGWHRDGVGMVAQDVMRRLIRELTYGART